VVELHRRHDFDRPRPAVGEKAAVFSGIAYRELISAGRVLHGLGGLSQRRSSNIDFGEF
jgi:hypothetical protein